MASATDHCTFSMAQRLQISKGDFSRCPNGLPGVENRMQLLFSSGVMTGRITPERFVELTSAMPARLFGLWPQKGLLAPCSDGDVVSTHVRANKFSIAISTTTPTTRHGRVLPVRARLSEPYPVVKRFSVTAPLQAKPGEVDSCDANRLSLPCSNHCQGSIHNQE